MNKNIEKVEISWVTPRIGITDAKNGQLAVKLANVTVINVAAEVKNEAANISLPLFPMACEKNKLDFLANYINYWIRTKSGRLVVHCLRGEDRSPLVVAWYFHQFRDMTLDEAYSKIKEKRPQVNNRRDWIVNITPVTLETDE